MYYLLFEIINQDHIFMETIFPFLCEREIHNPSKRMKKVYKYYCGMNTDKNQNSHYFMHYD